MTPSTSQTAYKIQAPPWSLYDFSQSPEAQDPQCEDQQIQEEQDIKKEPRVVHRECDRSVLLA